MCDAPVPVLGGSWNRENVIIFGGAVGSAILRVSAAGGVPSPVTTIDKSRLELFHTYPSFLPDGRHFLYLRVGVNHRGVYIGSLDARPEEQDSKQLLATGYSPAYVPAADPAIGRLLFIRDVTLMAQTFDARRLELTGEPVPIAEPVLTYRTDGFFSVSSNGILAYRGGGGRNTQLAWFDREGGALGTVAEAGEYREVALSPDGARVAVSRRDPQTQDFRFEIWQGELPRAAKTRITFHSSLSGSPVWSPDSRRIAFFNRGRDGVSTLLEKAASGAGNEESLVQSSDAIYPTDWSREGSFLLYSDVDPKTKSDLWVLPLTGDRKPTAYLRTEFDESQGQFSPDTRWIAYVSDKSGRREVYVQPFDSSSAPRAETVVSSGGGSQPRWRRDGRELFYLSPDRKLMAVDVTTKPTFQTGVPRPLFTLPVFTSPADVQRYDVTGDGGRFLIIADSGETALTPITVVLNWTALLKR